MNPFSILLTDDFGDEVEILPVQGLPYPVFLKIASLDGSDNELAQATLLREAIGFALCKKEDEQKIDALNIEQFGSFVTRWIEESNTYWTTK